MNPVTIVPVVACLLLTQQSAPSPTDIEVHWGGLLEEADGAKAFQSILALSRDERTVPWLKERLRPTPPVDTKKIDRLIHELDSPRFALRQGAFEELERLRELARPAIQKALAGKPSLEARRRLDKLLASLGGPLRGERLRTWRALEVLERIGTPAARDLLMVLAAGPDQCETAQEARRALSRLN